MYHIIFILIYFYLSLRIIQKRYAIIYVTINLFVYKLMCGTRGLNKLWLTKAINSNKFNYNPT